MPEKNRINRRHRDVLMFSVGAVIFFALGWYFQSGWTRVRVESPPPSTVVQDTKTEKIVEEPMETKSIADFRLERDREQSRQRERLQEMLTSAGSGTDWTKQVQSDLLSLERRINHEHELENLLAARGYPDTAVSVNESSVTVVIKGKALAPDQVGLIGQWTADVTGYPIGKIRIADQE